MEQNDKPKAENVAGARVGRMEVGINVIVQVAVLIVGLYLLNRYISTKYYARWDWSHGKNITLSAQTKALLGGLEKPVQVIVMFAATGETEVDAKALLREYKFAAKGKLTIEEVDPYANPVRSKELQTQFRFGDRENIVVFVYDGRHKFVNSSDLPEYEDAPLAMSQRRQPEVTGFRGEQVFTSTLIELTETKQNKLYFVAAHGEYDGESRELGEFREYLTRQNLKFETLKLADKDQIPEDASMIAILRPSFDFSERDLKLLTEYWDRKGRIFIGTGWTNGKTPNLNQWLAARGVRPQNDTILRVRPVAGNLVQIDPPGGIVTKQRSPITKEIEGIGNQFIGPTQSLELDRNLEKAAGLQLTSLIVAPEGYWGETEYDPSDRTNVPAFDPRKDHVGPLTLGASVERGGAGDPKVKLETSRLVVFGNGDFLSDKGLQLGQVSLELGLNSINWLLNRENLINVPPKMKERHSLKLTDGEVATIRWWVMLFIPAIVGVFGLYHLMWRSGKNIFMLTFWLAVVFLVFIASWYTLQWRLGLWKPTFRMSPAFWLTIVVAVAIGVAAAIANRLEQKRRMKPQD